MVMVPVRWNGRLVSRSMVNMLNLMKARTVEMLLQSNNRSMTLPPGPLLAGTWLFFGCSKCHGRKVQLYTRSWMCWRCPGLVERKNGRMFSLEPLEEVLFMPLDCACLDVYCYESGCTSSYKSVAVSCLGTVGGTAWYESGADADASAYPSNILACFIRFW